MKRSALALIIVAALALQGCTYLGQRLKDAGEMADIGITVSEKPEFAAYGCAFGLLSGGYGHINGNLLGLAGGHVGLVPLKQDVWGLGPVGQERSVFADGAPRHRCTGAICIVQETPEGMEKSSSCCHYLHLGFLGLAGNIHYKEILDFVLGFAGLDICNDDELVQASAPRAEPPTTAASKPPATLFTLPQ